MGLANLLAMLMPEKEGKGVRGGMVVVGREWRLLTA